MKAIFVRLFGYSWDLDPQFYMEYNYMENISIIVALKVGERDRQYISLEYSDELYHAIKELQKEIRSIHYGNIGVIRTSLALANEERRRNHEMITRRVNEIFGDMRETYYIPAGRSLLTVMSNKMCIRDRTYVSLVYFVVNHRLTIRPTFP